MRGTRWIPVLSGGAVLVMLSLGLVQRWGEVYPRWIPFVRGRRVHPRTAVVPASIVAVLVTTAGLANVRVMLSGLKSLDWGTGPFDFLADQQP